MFLIACGGFLILQGCVKDNFDFDKLSTTIKMNPAISAPLVYGSLTLSDVIRVEDSLIFYNEDNSIYILFREDSVFSIQLSDILMIPDQDSVVTFLDIQPAEIDDFTTKALVTLYDIVHQINDSLAAIFMSLDGKDDWFPPIDENDLGFYSFDLIETIDFLLFAEGNLDVVLTNKLPTTLNSIGVTLFNVDDGSIIASFYFNSVEPNESKSQQSDLSGVLIRNLVTVEINFLDIAGSYPEIVNINLQDYLQFNLSSQNAKVVKGRAVLPDQVVLEQVKMINLAFPDEQIALNTLHLQEARLNYFLQLETDESFRISVVLPQTTRNNSVVQFSLITAGSGGIMNGWWDLSNTVSDLTTNSIYPCNNFPVNYFVEFVSTGEMIEFDLTGHLDRFLNLNITDALFEYAEGYLGETIVNFSTELFDFELDFINKLTGTSVLTNPGFNIFFDYSFGLPFRIALGLTGMSQNGDISLDYSEFYLAGANSTGDVVFDTISINTTNSNLPDFIAFRPTSFILTGNAMSNPDGYGSHTNFIHSGSHLNANIEFELPLEIQLHELRLVDTLEIDLSSDIFNNLDSLLLSLHVENGFPLAAIVDLTLINLSSNNSLHTFDNIAILDAAPVNSQGTVPDGQRSVSESDIIIPADVLNKIHMVDHIIISVLFNTSGQGEVPVKLLSSYSLDFKILTTLNFSLL